MINLYYLWYFCLKHINASNNTVSLELIYENVKYMVDVVIYDFSLYCYIYIKHLNDQINLIIVQRIFKVLEIP